MATAAIEKDKRLALKRAEVRDKEQTLNDEQSNGERRRNSTLSARDQHKQDFYAKFGDAEASLQRARNDANAAKGVCSSRIWLPFQR